MTTAPDPEAVSRRLAAEGELMRLISEGHAEEIMNAYSEHSQSCFYVHGIILHTATEPDTTQLVTAQEFARNLLDDWNK